MNREIKFRAWDEDCNIMVYSDEHNKEEYQDCEYAFTTNDEGCISCWWGTDYDDSFGDTKSIFGYLDKIMQCTGIKDCEEKEIYEGDIVEIVGWEKEYYEVVFYDFGFKLKKLSKEPMFWESRYRNFYKDNFNIIGNVYQNRDLLEIK